MTRKEMIDIIMQFSPEKTASSFKKLKIPDITDMYNKIITEHPEILNPPDNDNDNDNDNDDDYEKCEINVEDIKETIFMNTIFKQMKIFNDYFVEITKYPIDYNSEQAIPRDFNWYNKHPDNLSIFVDWDTKTYSNADEEAFAKNIKDKYNYLL